MSLPSVSISDIQNKASELRISDSSFRLKDIGYSNSVFRVLAQGGIYLAFMYIVPMIKTIQEAITTQNRKKFGFLLIFLYYFITTSFPYNYICYMSLFVLFFCKNETEKRLAK